MTALCRSCRAPVRWAFTESGKKIPLDPEPSEQGNVMLGGSGNHLVATVLSGALLHEERALGTRLYVAHWATCSDSNGWRKRDRGKDES